jgi:hypothetical protein
MLRVCACDMGHRRVNFLVTVPGPAPDALRSPCMRFSGGSLFTGEAGGSVETLRPARPARLASGQTLFGFVDPPIVIPLSRSRKICLLAMTGPNRLPELPEAPTAAEAEFGNIDARMQWIGCIRNRRDVASDRAKARGRDPPSGRRSGRA